MTPSRLRAFAFAAVALVVTLASGTSAVSAEDVTRAEAAERAAAAAASGNPSSYSPLLEVTSVDGRPVDIEAVLVGDDADVSARLRALGDAWAGSAQGQAEQHDSPAVDRRRAEEVLEQGKFHEPDVPRPFRRPLRWLGDRISEVWERAADFLSPVLGRVGSRLLLVGLLVAGLAAVLTIAIKRISKGQTSVGSGRSGWLVDPTLDPADLERRAAEATSSGDHALAVRLRYEAGLLRLVAAGRLELRPETTASSAAAAVDDPTMDDLTAAFEEIVYGGRVATPEDDSASAQGWPSVLRAKAAKGSRVAEDARAGKVAR